MTRLPSPALVLASSLGLIAATGCSMMPDPALATYQRALVLEVIGIKSGRTGPRLVVDLKLSNRGDQVIVACIGASRSMSTGSASSIELTHHTGCVRNFTLAPDAELVWPETFERVPTPPDNAKIEVSIEVLNPRRCGSTGCSRITLTATRD